MEGEDAAGHRGQTQREEAAEGRRLLLCAAEAHLHTRVFVHARAVMNVQFVRRVWL